jgi:hypothetical protein
MKISFLELFSSSKKYKIGNEINKTIKKFNGAKARAHRLPDIIAKNLG